MTTTSIAPKRAKKVPGAAFFKVNRELRTLASKLDFVSSAANTPRQNRRYPRTILSAPHVMIASRNMTAYIRNSGIEPIFPPLVASIISLLQLASGGVALRAGVALRRGDGWPERKYTPTRRKSVTSAEVNSFILAVHDRGDTW